MGLNGEQTNNLLHIGHIGESEKLKDVHEELAIHILGNAANPTARGSMKKESLFYLIILNIIIHGILKLYVFN